MEDKVVGEGQIRGQEEVGSSASRHANTERERQTSQNVSRSHTYVKASEWMS